MKKILISFVFTAILFSLSNCKKKTDEPPVKNIAAGTIYTVEQLKSIATCTNNCNRRFALSGSDAYFIGTVIADEVSGNFYKEIYLRDRTGSGGIRLDLVASNNGFFIGDSVRVILNGLDIGINSSTGMLEIDSLDHEKSLVKFGTGPAPAPKVISLANLTPGNPYSNYLCDLVTITDVAFLPTDANQFWADVVGQASLNRTIQDCAGNQIVVRTSNYASFASQKTPTGFGSITGIATAYGTTNQLVIRRPGELQMNGTGCVVYHKKDWNDNSLTSGGWTQSSVVNPAVVWTASSFNTDKFAKISGFISGNTNSENWLISPVINLSSAFNPVLTFRTAAKFSGNLLEVLVSTNYTSGLPSTANWTPLSGYTLSSNAGNYVWTNSGDVNLSSYKNANVRIAFKYTSTTTASTTYEVDDFIVLEK